MSTSLEHTHENSTTNGDGNHRETLSTTSTTSTSTSNATINDDTVRLKTEPQTTPVTYNNEEKKHKNSVKRSQDEARKQFIPPTNPQILSGDLKSIESSTNAQQQVDKTSIQRQSSTTSTRTQVIKPPSQISTIRSTSPASISIKHDPRERFGHFKRW